MTVLSKNSQLMSMSMFPSESAVLSTARAGGKLLRKLGREVMEKATSFSGADGGIDSETDDESPATVHRSSYDIKPEYIGRMPTLHRAAWKGKKMKVLKYFAKKDKESKVNKQDRYGRTALHYAASCGNLAVVQLLLSINGVDVDMKDGEGCTAFFKAVEFGCNSCMTELKERGANVNMTNSRGITPAESVITNVKEDNLSTVQFMLDDMGITLDITNRLGMSLLHVASLFGRADICKLLIERGLDINALDTSGRSPLLIATISNQEEVCKLLLAEGANQELPDEPECKAEEENQNGRFWKIVEAWGEHKMGRRPKEIPSESSTDMTVVDADDVDGESVNDSVELVAIDNKAPVTLSNDDSVVNLRELISYLNLEKARRIEDAERLSRENAELKKQGACEFHDSDAGRVCSDRLPAIKPISGASTGNLAATKSKVLQLFNKKSKKNAEFLVKHHLPQHKLSQSEWVSEFERLAEKFDELQRAFQKALESLAEKELDEERMKEEISSYQEKIRISQKAATDAESLAKRMRADMEQIKTQQENADAESLSLREKFKSMKQKFKDFLQRSSEDWAEAENESEELRKLLQAKQDELVSLGVQELRSKVDQQRAEIDGKNNTREMILIKSKKLKPIYKQLVEEYRVLYHEKYIGEMPEPEQ